MKQVLTHKEAVVSVDIGTSGTRATVFTPGYEVLKSSSRPLTVRVGRNGESTQSWPEIVGAVQSTVSDVTRDARLAIHAIALSGTASNLAVSYTRGREGHRNVQEIILWSDTRAAAFSDAVAPDGESHDYFSSTLCPTDFSYWPAKLRWLASLQTSGLEGLQFGGAKDYLFELLTGHFWVDPMTAAATGVFDSDTWQWHPQLLEGLGLAPGQLPELRQATDQAPLLAPMAKQLGLPEGTPVVLGGMDGPLAQLGSCGFSTDLHTCTLGTSVAYRAGSVHRVVDPAKRVWCYPISSDFWVIGGAGSNGGNVLDWLASAIGSDPRGAADVASLVAQALTVKPGTDLLFLPYMNGERAPLWRADLRGAIIGLRPHHSRVDIARAALDGIGSAIIELSGAVTEMVAPPSQVALTGGFLQEGNWPQLVTDFLGRPTFVPEPQTATSTGGAMLAWLSLGEAAPPAPGPAAITQRRVPDAANHKVLAHKAQLIRQARFALFGEGPMGAPSRGVEGVRPTAQAR